MSNLPSITILIATYNRADSLGQTLAAIAAAESDGIDCQTVVIDNRCSDHTAEVVTDFADRMSVSRFVADRAGKSCALNDALAEVELGEIVVFADDDITPSAGWLRAISDSVRNWPEHQVFGGKIVPDWPDGQPPVGLRAPGARRWALGAHDHGSEDRVYPPGETPVGMNWWARREVFGAGRRFNESIGPNGTAVIMGEDTHFLKGLLADGLAIVYVPGALVGHRIDRERLTEQALKTRAYAQGRGGPHVHGLCQPAMLEAKPRIWKLRRTVILWRARMRYLWTHLGFSAEGRVRRRLEALSDIGYNTEALRLTRTHGPDAAGCEVSGRPERRQDV